MEYTSRFFTRVTGNELESRSKFPPAASPDVFLEAPSYWGEVPAEFIHFNGKLGVVILVHKFYNSSVSTHHIRFCHCERSVAVSSPARGLPRRWEEAPRKDRR